MHPLLTLPLWIVAGVVVGAIIGLIDAIAANPRLAIKWIVPCFIAGMVALFLGVNFPGLNWGGFVTGCVVMLAATHLAPWVFFQLLARNEKAHQTVGKVAGLK